MPPFGILELLRLRGLPVNARLKFVRHQDNRYDVQKLIRDGHFELYQASQAKPVFDKLDYIISLLGAKGKTARFYGIYEVHGRKISTEDLFPANFPYPEWYRTPHLFYDLRRDPRFDPFKYRITIDWGGSTLSWHQHGTTDKPILELKPPGSTLAVFEDYLDFTLTHGELHHLVTHADANHEWEARLSAVSGIYLILDQTTGQQYIGSAHGTNGIWGRWKDYALTGHGGNRKLIDLLSVHPERKQGFIYSILQIVPKTYSKDLILDLEQRYKQKLGTRATGLNDN